MFKKILVAGISLVTGGLDTLLRNYSTTEEMMKR